jgi:ribosome maturation factor RimP
MLRRDESEPRLAFLFFGGPVEAQIAELLAPIAEELGLDVLKVSLGGGHHQQLLRVVVDAAGGVPFELLTRASRALSLQLDAADLIQGRYRLEVTSPGLDWPLTTEADFRRHEGELLKVVFADGTTLIGGNLGACEGGVRLGLEDGSERAVALGEVARIVRSIDWKRAAHGGKQDV